MRRWPVVILLFFFNTPSVLGQYEIPPEPEAAPLGKPQKIFGDANMHKAQEELPELSSPPNYVRPDNSPGEPLEHVGTPEVSAPGVETKDEAKVKSGEGIAAHKDGEYETKASAEEQVAHASAGPYAETTAASTTAVAVETSTAAGATTAGSAAETKGEGSYDSAVPAGDSKEAAAPGEVQKAVETTPVAETPTTTTAEASTQAVTQGTTETPKETGYEAPEAPKAESSAEAPKATSSEEVPKAESSGSAGDGYSAAASEGSAPSGTDAPKTEVFSSEAPSGYDQPAAAAPPETPAPAMENKATGQKEEAVTTEASKEEATTTAGSSEAPKSSESYSAPKESSEATTTEATTTTSSGTDLKAAGDGYSDGKTSAESAPSGTKGAEGSADAKPAAGGDNGYSDGKAEETPKAEATGSAPSGAADVKPSGSSEGGYGEPLTPAPSEVTTTSAAAVPSAETKAQGEKSKEDDKTAAEIPKTACKPGEESKTSEGEEKSKEASHEVEGSGDKSKETSSEEGAKKDKYVEHNDLNREGSGSSEVPEGSGLSAPADNSVTLAPEGTRNPPAAPTSAEIEAATLAPYPKSSEEEGSGNSVEAGDKYASKESPEGSGSKSGEEKSKSSEEGSGEEQPSKEEQNNSAEKGSSPPKSEGYSTDGEKHVEGTPQNPLVQDELKELVKKVDKSQKKTTEWQYVTSPGERTAAPGVTLAPEASRHEDGEPLLETATDWDIFTATTPVVLVDRTDEDSATVTSTNQQKTTNMRIVNSMVEPSGYEMQDELVIVNSPELPPIKPEEAMGYEGISKEDFRADIPQPKQELSQNSDVKIVEKQTQPTISSSSSASPLEQNRKTWIPYRFDCETEEDDKGPLCKEWAEGGLCEQHKPTMFLFCRRTCLCTGPFARRRRHALLN